LEKRKYYFLSKNALVDCCMRELGGPKTAFSRQTVDDLILLLSQPRVALQRDNPTAVPNQRPDIESNTLSDALIKQIIGGANLKPLSGSGRQNTRIGLDNEIPLLKRLVEESKETKVLLPNEGFSRKHLIVSEIYRPGMAKRVGMDYAKSSIDALGVCVGVELGDEPKLIGIEVKTRTEETTRQPEIQLRSNLQRGERFVKINYKL